MIAMSYNPLNKTGIHESILIDVSKKEKNNWEEQKFFLTVKSLLINVERIRKLEKSSFNNLHCKINPGYQNLVGMNR